MEEVWLEEEVMEGIDYSYEYWFSATKIKGIVSYLLVSKVVTIQ